MKLLHSALLALSALATALPAANGYAWSMMRTESLAGVNAQAATHRRCKLVDEGLVVDQNIGTWKTHATKDITRHFIANAKTLIASAAAVDAHLADLPVGTPVVNYWVTPGDDSQGFLIRSEQFTAGRQTVVKVDNVANESLVDFLDLACNAN